MYDEFKSTSEEDKFWEDLRAFREKETAAANKEAEVCKADREKARKERRGTPALESKTSLSQRKNGKIIYTDGTEEILECNPYRLWRFRFLQRTYQDRNTGQRNVHRCMFVQRLQKLSHVTIPESVTEIKGDAFSNCESLETVVILGDPKFGMHAFAYCANLKNIHMPCVSNIYIAVFYHCMALESLVLPSGLKKLGLSNFNNCPKLSLVTIPAAIEEIEDDCFWECPEFKTVNLSVADGVTKISKEDFCWCPAMAWKPPVPGRTKMGKRSFPKIETVGIILPASITEISDAAFEYVSNLKNIYYAGTKEEFAKINVGKNNPKINGIFGKAKIYYNSVGKEK